MFLRQLVITPLSSIASVPLEGVTAGSILFVESDLTLGQDNAALFWDATNDRLGIGTNAPAATLSVTQPALAATNAPAMKLIAGAHTALAAGTEAQDVYYDLSRTVQFATGAIATQRAFYIDAPTYAFVGASVITTAATFVISGPPAAGTNATITNPFSLWVQSGNNVFQRDGLTTVTAAGLTLTNTTDSTVGVPVQVSPSVLWHAEVWDTDGSNQTEEWQAFVTPTSTGTPYSAWALQFQQNGGGWATRLSVNTVGTFSVMAALAVSAGITTGYGTLTATGANVGLTLKGNKDAADTGYDVILAATSLTRSAGGIVQVQRPAVSTNQYEGLTITNSTAANVGAQQYSPMLTLTGYGNGSTTVQASQAVDFAFQVRTVQGAAAPTGALDIYSRVGGGAWVSYVNISTAGTLSTGPLTAFVAAVGTAQTMGLQARNTTAATAGSQQYSPMIQLTGSGWKTDTTAGSQVVDFAFQTVPVQGAAAPSGNLNFYTRINAGSWLSLATLSSAGALALTPQALSGAPSTTGSYFNQATATFTDNGTMTGTGDSIAFATPTVTLVDAGGAFRSTDVGGFITIAGATLPGNNGTFPITGWTSATTITYTNTGGGTVTEAFTYTVNPPIFAGTSFQAPTLAASNATTTTWASTVYISGAPITGANQTITNATALLIDYAGLAATTKPGIVLANRTDATAGATVQVSPSILWHAEVWDTDGVSRTKEWQVYVLPSSSGSPVSYLSFNAREDAGASVVRAAIDDNGRFNLYSSSLAGVYAGTADTVINVVGNKAAGNAATADVVIKSTAVRTAGSILYVANTTTNRLDVTFRGQLLMTPSAWTATLGTSTTGQLANTAAVTHTIDDAAGTYATWYGTALQAPTIAGAGADRIITDAATLFVAAPIASTLTITNAMSAVFATSIKLTTGYIEQAEMTAPAAPGANGVRIFAQDNGAGKTQLLAIFASGAAQQIAIEP